MVIGILQKLLSVSFIIEPTIVERSRVDLLDICLSMDILEFLLG